ncbi:stage II sporulation protein M [Streptomonospora sp. S1-112]|uniref:Stage II sporulation protein M n=1 Tax=Streptomonospora mangrovi TaxID=2883123 RepID=A0A9X3NKZ7_9ACTN|nr:stage II sporulation protein M [Streptomonospora mangrovi]MDA0565238.1 stage II sporulation protein M [Streptomonospora mangrovi]
MRLLRTPLGIIRANFGAYLVVNALIYIPFLLGMGAALVFPDLGAAEQAAMRENGTTGLVTSLLDDFWLFSLTIFAVNTLTVGVLTILLPSMVVPFAGIAAFMYRVFTIGVALAPVNATVATTLVPHSLTVLIEFQAYALVMLGAYLLGRAWLRPAAVGARTRRQGYLHGLRQTGWLCLPALALFVVGALYESFEIIYLLPLLFAR